MRGVRRTPAQGVPPRGDPVQGFGLLRHGFTAAQRQLGRRGPEGGVGRTDRVGQGGPEVLGLRQGEGRRHGQGARLGVEGEVGLTTGSDPVRVGVFGGSGFYSFLDDPTEVSVDTPYGDPSAPVMVGSVEGTRVAFIPRHGRKHQFPPHLIPYRANLWAFKELGVERVVGPNAVGSLQPHVKPGEFVVCDQLVDRTSGRSSTFYDGPVTTHISFADPYCPTMRSVAIEEAKAIGLSLHEQGTVVVIQG